jgi:hypothetical protein
MHRSNPGFQRFAAAANLLPPSHQDGIQTLQLFGLAASIAARLTIWPISLACCA